MTPEKRPARPRLRLLASLAFWFFLLKGLLWLVAPAVIVALGAWPGD